MSTLVANQTFWYGNRFFVRDETLVDSSDPVVAGHSAFFDTWAGGGGGGGATSPLVLTSTGTTQVPLTIEADAGQTGDLLLISAEEDGTAFVLRATEGDSDILSVDSIGYLFAAGGAALGGSYDANGLEVDTVVDQTEPAVIVKDGFGAAMFRIDPDGTVHIKTGTTIIADL